VLKARATRIRALEQARRLLPGIQHHRRPDPGSGGPQGGGCLEGTDAYGLINNALVFNEQHLWM